MNVLSQEWQNFGIVAPSEAGRFRAIKKKKKDGSDGNCVTCRLECHGIICILLHWQSMVGVKYIDKQVEFEDAISDKVWIDTFMALIVDPIFIAFTAAGLFAVLSNYALHPGLDLTSHLVSMQALMADLIKRYQARQHPCFSNPADLN